jgi:hypothetical protein
MRPTLDQLDRDRKCDKASWAHDYFRIYDELFTPFRDAPIKFLEIGVEFGISAKIWLEYFKNAIIYGVDIKKQHTPDNLRFVFEEGDQRDPIFWRGFIKRCGEVGFDVIIDDGCHKTIGIMTSLIELLPHVNPGGFYIVEDLMCSYHQSCQEPSWPPQIEFLKTLVDEVNCQTRYVNTAEPRLFHEGIHGNMGIDWVRFSEELCIIKKK